MIAQREPNGSITLDVTSGSGSPRKLNINSYHVANTRHAAISLAILGKDEKFLGDVILGAVDIKVLLTKIGELL